MAAAMPGPRWSRPVDLGDALSRLREGRWTVLAGGTDYYAGRVGRPLDEPLLDITGIDALRGIAQARIAGAPALRVGALTTWSELLRASLPAAFDALTLAAREVGGPQVQNRGTLGGNLCNASAAADGAPALLALDASVELASVAGVRTLPLSGFLLGNRRTARRADEILAAVLLPLPGAGARSLFLKLGHRRYLVISIAMAGLALEADAQGRVARCAVAVGACSEVAQRLPALERRVLGMPAARLAGEASSLLDDEALAPLAPLDDVRGSAAYRREAAAQLIARGLAELARTIAG